LPRAISSSFSTQVADASVSFCTLRGITASRRPHTATYSDGPGRRESVMQAVKPTCSTKRSASNAVSI
jgi:hypothetical protein